MNNSYRDQWSSFLYCHFKFWSFLREIFSFSFSTRRVIPFYFQAPTLSLIRMNCCNFSLWKQFVILPSIRRTDRYPPFINFHHDSCISKLFTIPGTMLLFSSHEAISSLIFFQWWALIFLFFLLSSDPLFYLHNQVLSFMKWLNPPSDSHADLWSSTPFTSSLLLSCRASRVASSAKKSNCSHVPQKSHSLSLVRGPKLKTMTILCNSDIFETTFSCAKIDSTIF